MAANQGLYRLEAGVVRHLNKAELARGFLFVSKDKKVISMLEDSFDVVLDGEIVMSDVHLDGYGRITGARLIVSELDVRPFMMRIKDDDLYLDTVI